MKKKFLYTSTIAILSLTGFSGAANAAGFYIQEQSVSGLGTSYAGQAAIARDASIIFFNPAGLTHLDRAQLNVGLHLIAPHVEVSDIGSTINNLPLSTGALGLGNISDGGNPGSVSPIPNAYIATPVNDSKSLWLGIGLSAPFGLGSEYDEDFFGQFISTASKLETIDIQPTIAYQPVDWFSIGLTGIVQHADANLKQSLFAGAGNVNGVRVTGDDTSFGYNIGVMLKPIESLTFGASYRSEISHKLEGDVEFDRPLGGLFTDSEADADLDLPDLANFGLAYDINDRWTALAGAVWTGWNDFDRLIVNADTTGVLPINVLFNYQTTWAYSLGAEYKATEDWTLRTGWQYDATPTRSEGRSTLNPDGDRNWFSVGATYQWDQDFSFDFGATYIDVHESHIEQTRGVTVVRGETSNTNVLIGALALNYKF